MKILILLFFLVGLFSAFKITGIITWSWWMVVVTPILITAAISVLGLVLVLSLWKS